MQTGTVPIAAVPNPSGGADLYLHTVEELNRQLEQAMEAIVARSLPAFEDCVSRQRAACSQLLALPRYLHPSSESATALPDSGVDPDLTARIAAAGVTLQSLNKRYSALLGHTGDTMRLLARLINGYRTPASAETAAGQAKVSTWSCEV